MGYNWKDTIREKMSGYTEAEPEGLLQDIMKELDKHPAVIAPAGKSRSTVKRLILTAAVICSAAAASIAILAVVLKEEPSVPHKSQIAIAQYDTPQEQVEIIKENILTPKQQTETVRQTSGTTKLPVLIAEAVQKNAVEPEIIDKNTAAITDDSFSGSSDTSSNSETSGNSDYNNEELDNQYNNYSLKDEWEYNFPENDNSGKKNRFSADIFYSNLASSSTSAAGYSTMRQLGSTPFNGIPDRGSVSATPGEGLMLITSGENSNTTVRHRHPVRAGVTFRYKFAKCWGIETGLVYSFLSSRMETSESRYKNTTEQKLHYIGIPLKVNWSFLNREHFTLYLNAGGMLEKCVAGNAKTDYTINGNSISSDKYSISAKPVQWSASAAAGVQWKITDLVGIYAEPGISYHFRDGSPISTIYKEKPLNFNLEIGLRFTFE